MPFPSHGFSNVPGPLEPLGQSLRGGNALAGGGADAADAGAVDAVGGGEDADAEPAGPGFVSSLEQPNNSKEAMIAVVIELRMSAAR